jgi:hypothetical protein
MIRSRYSNPLADVPTSDRDRVAEALVYGLPARTSALNQGLQNPNQAVMPQPSALMRSQGPAPLPGVSPGAAIYSRPGLPEELLPSLKARDEARRQDLFRQAGMILGQSPQVSGAQSVQLPRGGQMIGLQGLEASFAPPVQKRKKRGGGVLGSVNKILG